MSKVVLTERVGRLQSFNLPHEQYCAVRGECSCSQGSITMTDRDPRTGKPIRRPVQRRTPISFTLLPRKSTEPMDAAVLDCPDVESALKAHQLAKRMV